MEMINEKLVLLYILMPLECGVISTHFLCNPCYIQTNNLPLGPQKLGDNITSVFILSFFCGILMFVAADGYKTIQNPVGQILAIFLPVVVFILSGFEHCVANMYFFTIADLWSFKAFGYLIIMSLGNSIGGILIPLLRKGFVSKA